MTIQWSWATFDAVIDDMIIIIGNQLFENYICKKKTTKFPKYKRSFPAMVVVQLLYIDGIHWNEYYTEDELIQQIWWKC